MKKYTIPAVAVAAALLLAGCSGGSNGSSGSETSTDNGAAVGTSLEQSDVTIGVLPVADYAAAYIAVDEGYFEEEGLNVTLETMQNAAAVVPGVLNGQVQFGTGALSPIISAASTGLPVVFVANAADTPLSAELDPTMLGVSASSGITSPKELEGKTVAVNALQAAAELFVREVVEKDGGDPTTLTFVAMPFGDTPAALERGDVDAGFLIEPFTSVALDQGLVSISSLFYEAAPPGQTHAAYFSSKDFVAKAPNTVAAFDRAIGKAAEAATANPDLVRAVLQKYGNLAPDVAERIILPGYSAVLSTESIENNIDMMERHGFLEEKGAIAVEDLVVQ